MHGVGNDPTYNAKSCFETFPFPAGLTPADTAHQRVEHLSSGACIPTGILQSNQPEVLVFTNQAATKLIVNTAAVHTAAIAIAQAAKQLDDLRNQWLNPPEWTHRVPEVTPLGMTTSPYPDRVLPRDNLGEQDAKALQKRTLTNLYNLRQDDQVHWLDHAHQQLDAAVASAYGWADYSHDMTDATILERLLALNLARSAQ